MTTRGMILVALMLAAMLALTAPAAMAASPLSAKQARKYANQLGRQQMRDNDVIVFHAEHLKRVNSNEIDFAYDERTKFKVFCTAVLRVRRTVSGNNVNDSATLTRHRCKAIPKDALSVEKATAKANRRIRRNDKKTLRAVRRVQRSVERCRDLKVPRNHRAAARAVNDVAITGAIARPSQGALDAFAADLGRVKASRDVVVRAIEGWVDYGDALGSLPKIHDPCAVLQNWAKAGWSAQQKPIDMAKYRALLRRSRADAKAIGRGAVYLLNVGVFRKVAVAFTPDGLLLFLAGD